jgi:hypothetical protein
MTNLNTDQNKAIVLKVTDDKTGKLKAKLFLIDNKERFKQYDEIK